MKKKNIYNDKMDKLADKIHNIFINSKNLSIENLAKICHENNIFVNDYLYLQCYVDFETYLQDINN